MARQACERFRIPRACGSVAEMLDACRPQVVHITTPPQGHFAIARECLERGCHVYVEKPFTIDAPEAEALVALAEERSRKLTVGHDLQYSPVARRLREAVRSGYLGGDPVHLESYYCYDLTDARYARVLLADKQHWVRKLPGGLLQNIISHGLARVAEYFADERPRITAVGFTSRMLRDLGERDLVDELRVVLSSESGLTAYFTFSSQMQPSLNHFRVYGPRNGLVLDEDEQCLLRLRGARFKSYAQKFLPPVLMARQHLGNLAGNLRRFAAADFHMKSGMKCLIESFYRSITENAPLPISYREILFVARTMDEIFRQLKSGA